MKRLIGAVALAAAMVVGATPAAVAHGPTCSDLGLLGVANHGEHVIRDYVKGEVKLPGGPGAKGHLPAGIAPGASFCNPQSQSPGFHVP